MKTRQGFISNSSSTSFIAIFSADVNLPNSDLMTIQDHIEYIIKWEGNKMLTTKDVLTDDWLTRLLIKHMKEDEKFYVGRIGLGAEAWENTLNLIEALGGRGVLIPY